MPTRTHVEGSPKYHRINMIVAGWIKSAPIDDVCVDEGHLCIRQGDQWIMLDVAGWNRDRAFPHEIKANDFHTARKRGVGAWFPIGG